MDETSPSYRAHVRAVGWYECLDEAIYESWIEWNVGDQILVQQQIAIHHQ